MTAAQLIARILIPTLLATSAVSQAHTEKHRKNHMHKPAQASLQASASTEVQQDTLTISVVAEVSSDSQKDVSDSLAKITKQAMDIAKSSDNSVTVYSGNYRVWPVNDKKGQITGWRGSSEIMLKSQDFAKASKLAADMGPDMSIRSWSFSVSDESYNKAEQELLEQAAEAFKQRASDVAKAMGFDSYKLVNINLGGAGSNYKSPQMMRAAVAAADSSVVSVPAEGTTETVSLDISGTIYLLTE